MATWAAITPDGAPREVEQARQRVDALRAKIRDERDRVDQIAEIYRSNPSAPRQAVERELHVSPASGAPANQRRTGGPTPPRPEPPAVYTNS